MSVSTLYQIIKDKYGYIVYYKRVWEAKRKTIMVVVGMHLTIFYLSG